MHYSGTRTVSGVVWNDMQIRVSRGKLGAIIGTKYGYSISISAYRMENAIKYVDIEYERYYQVLYHYYNSAMSHSFI